MFIQTEEGNFIQLRFPLNLFLDLKHIDDDLDIIFWLACKYGSMKGCDYSEASKLFDWLVETKGINHVNKMLSKAIDESVSKSEKADDDQEDTTDILIMGLQAGLELQDFDALTPKEVQKVIEHYLKMQKDESEKRSYETFMALWNIEDAKHNKNFKYQKLYNDESERDIELDAQQLLKEFGEYESDQG